MEKRTILAIILMFLVLVLWGIIESKFFPRSPPQPPKQEERREQAAPPGREAEKKEGIREARPEKTVPRPVTTKTVEKKEVSVETLNFWAVLTSEDARVKHLRLKQYEDRAKEHPITLKLVGIVHSMFGGKVEEPSPPMPLDLVNTEEREGLPLGITFSDPNLAQSDGNWEVDKERLKLLTSGKEGEITFVKTFEGGVKVFKRYEFSAAEEAVNLQVEIQNQSQKEVVTQVGLEWVGKVELKKLADDGNKDFGLKYAFFKNQKVEVNDLAGAGGSGCMPGCESVKKAIDPFDFTDRGEIAWYAFQGEYFAAMLFPPPSEKNVALSVKGNEKNLVKGTIMTSSMSIPSHQSVKIPFKVYMGPKDEDRLKKLGSGAERLVDFGWFTIVAKPILWLLNLTHKATKNYGIDIIIISILIKLIFIPLTQISYKSMKEMQKIQPEMNRLRQTYKNDKARLQQEIMLLYKRRKVNPMSGCLPMVIQIPVFVALYNALQNSIAMRHAPFFLWITDLSAKDPLYISPIIMGATMVIQQKMTPTAADPAQAKLFLLMPVMFTFLFLSFPSGLVMYWLIQNVLSIAHQYYINKR